MRRRRTGTSALTASPVLVGAVTLLVAIVAVFLSYNANSGLPFVPTYDLKAELPNAANLVKGNEVRIGGARVGVIDDDRRQCPTRTGSPSARARPEARRGPASRCRSTPPSSCARKSALGLKYVELTPGDPDAPGYQAGATVPVEAGHARARWRSTRSSTCSTTKARVGSQRSLNGFGTGLAGRGQDLNTLIRELRPLLDDLEPVAANLADQQTQLARFFGELGDAAAQVAPVAEVQADAVRQPGHHVRGSGRCRAVPAGVHLREPADARDRDRPSSRASARSCATAPRFFRELQPGVAHPAGLGARAGRRVRDRGRDAARRRPSSTAALAGVFDSLAEFAEDPRVPRGVRRLAARVALAAAHARLPHAGPDPVQLRHAALPQRARGTSPRATATAPGSASSSSRRRAGRTTRPGRRAPPPTARQQGQLPARQPVPEHRVAGPARRVRGRQRGLPGRAHEPRQRARQPGPADRRPARRGVVAMRRSGRFSPLQVGLIAIVVIAVGRVLRLHEGHPVHQGLRDDGGLREHERHRRQLAGAHRRRPGGQGHEGRGRGAGLDRRGGHDAARRAGAAAARRRADEDPASDLPRGQLLRGRRAGHPQRRRAARGRHDPLDPDQRAGPDRPGARRAQDRRTQGPPGSAAGLRRRHRRAPGRGGGRRPGPLDAGRDRGSVAERLARRLGGGAPRHRHRERRAPGHPGRRPLQAPPGRREGEPRARAAARPSCRA